jgi:DNA-binding MurR/RpiR family transcriptional regulator
LAAELGKPSTPADDMRRTFADVGGATASAVDMVLDAHMEAMETLRSPESRARIANAVATLHPAGRIVVFGIGPSSALAKYVATQLTRFGRRAKTLDVTGLMLADEMLDLGPGDAILALAYGRPYREIVAVFAEARRLGLPVVLVTDNPEHKLARSADVVLAARRGREERVALHGVTLVGLEALILGLADADQAMALSGLRRLDALRRAVNGENPD